MCGGIRQIRNRPHAHAVRGGGHNTPAGDVPHRLRIGIWPGGDLASSGSSTNRRPPGNACNICRYSPEDKATSPTQRAVMLSQSSICSCGPGCCGLLAFVQHSRVSMTQASPANCHAGFFFRVDRARRFRQAAESMPGRGIECGGAFELRTRVAVDRQDIAVIRLSGPI